jgi:DNA repair exonuclease SbcCD ATPase subunit
LDNALQIQRTPELIAAEINHIKDQTKFMMLNNSIEIGRRLTEAKQQLQHGEWGSWLADKVEFSKTTANNLMRIFEEYGNDQLALFGETGAKSQALGSLSYSQAVALLSIPGEEREQFIEENDAANMSTRELQQAIKERDQAREEKEKAEEANKDLNRMLSQIRDLLEKEQVAARGYFDESARLRKELEQAQAAGDEKEIRILKQELEQTDEMLKCANDEIDELKKELKEIQEKPIDVPATVEVIPPEIEAELAELRTKSKSAAELKFKLQFDALTSSFNSLLQTLDEIEPDNRAKYTNAVKTLINKMAEYL